MASRKIPGMTEVKVYLNGGECPGWRREKGGEVYLRTKDLARVSGIPERTLHTMAQDGRMPQPVLPAECRRLCLFPLSEVAKRLASLDFKPRPRRKYALI